jgi:hypothetical protein
MSVFAHNVGLIMESKDDIQQGEPLIAFKPVQDYLQEAPAPPHLKNYGKLERPQILFIKGKPAYLFITSQGRNF